MIFTKTEGSNTIHRRYTPFAMLAALLLVASMVTSAQANDKIVPIGEWAASITVEYDRKPLLVHLRTGYERTVTFPEPVSLHSINNRSATDGNSLELPNCKVIIAADIVGFAPLKRFKQQRVKLRGARSGRIYDLVVSSSPNGKRQPIQILK